MISLVSVALIPVANSFISSDSSRFYVTLLSSLSIICVGIIAIFNLKDSWLRYRSSLEMLKIECLLYKEMHGEYSLEDPIPRKELFIERIKTIACSESIQWSKALEKSSLLHGLHSS